MTETARCLCGCGTSFPRLDRWGRPRRYINGHNRSRTPKLRPGQRAAPVRVDVSERQAVRMAALLSRRGFSRSADPVGGALHRFRVVRLYPGRVTLEWNEPEAAPKRGKQAGRAKRKRPGRPPGIRVLEPKPPKFKATERVRLTAGQFAGCVGFVLEVPSASPRAHRRVKMPYRVQIDGRRRPVPAAEGEMEAEAR